MNTEIPKEYCNWAMIIHLSGLLGSLLFTVGNIVVPLVIWLIKKEDDEFIYKHGREVLNFQISMTLYFIISLILCFIFIGFIMIIGLLIFEIVVVIKAAIKASDGYYYDYPLTIRFIK